MKLSFSIRGWRGLGFEEFLEAACGMGYDGIELHNISNEHFAKGGAFYDYTAAATSRKLFEKHIFNVNAVDVKFSYIHIICNRSC